MRSFEGIQVMRGIAASLVMLGHTFLLHGGMGLPFLSVKFLTIFPAGVDIFFVISGFIISHTLALRKPTSRYDALTFAFRRVTRLYPIYWIALGASVLAGRFVPLSAPDFPMTSPIAFITASSTANWYIPQAWTLAFEVYFYFAVTCIIFITPRYVFPCIAAWLAAQAVAAALWSADVVHTHALIVEFGFGCAICYLTHNGMAGSLIRAASIVSALFFLAGAMLAAASPLAGWMRVATYGVGSAFLVYVMVAASIRGVRFPRPLIYLGNASFSLYIWHYAVLMVLLWICEWVGLLRLLPIWSEPLLALAWVAITVGFGIASYHFLERPMLWVSRHGLRALESLGPRPVNVLAACGVVHEEPARPAVRLTAGARHPLHDDRM